MWSVSRPRVVVAGYVVRYPLGGQAWAHLQYVIGFKRLGFGVCFLEDAGWPDSCYDPLRNAVGNDPSYGVSFLERALSRYGLGDAWAFRDVSGRLYGMSESQLDEVLSGEFVLVDLSAVSWFDEFQKAAARIYIDEDPAFPQFALAGGDSELRQILGRYDSYFSYGRNIGGAGCTIPSGGFKWHPTSPPIVLDLWRQPPPPPSAPLTTIMNWTSYANVEFEGEVYGQKDVEFEKVIDLPGNVSVPLELALGGVEAPADRLRAHGWRVTDPLVVTKSMDSYRRYIYGSASEFSVAKNAYVKTRSGWFSDRSAAYLAAGRPVVIQDTGFTDWLEAGEGVVAFEDLEGALEGVQSVVLDWTRHSRRALELASEHFDSRRVLMSLIERGMA